MTPHLKKIFSSKRNLIILFGCTVFLILAGVSIYFTPKLLAQSTTKTKITQYPNSLTSKDLIFTGEKPFAVVVDGKTFYSSEKSPFTANLGKISGQHDFQIHGFTNTGIIKVLSNDRDVVTIMGDYEGPKVAFAPLKKFYTDRQVEFTFETNEPDITLLKDDKLAFNQLNQYNDCKADIIDEVTKIKCVLDFSEDNNLRLNFAMADKLGNITQLYNRNIRYVLAPKLQCISPTLITNQAVANLSCSVNKAGVLKDSNNKETIFSKADKIDLSYPLNEGVNDLNFNFKDDTDLEDFAKLTFTKDTVAPTAEFTFLDSKKKFLEGSYSLGIKASEDVKATVSIQPYNDFVENTPKSRTAGHFDYSGGSVQERDVAGGSDQRFSTKNNMGTCQIIENDPNTIYVSQAEYNIISASFQTLDAWFKAHPGKTLSTIPLTTPTNFKYKNGYCNFYNGKFIRTVINLQDKAGNKSVYYCTGLIYDDKAPIKTDGKTRCSKDPSEIGCEWFYNEFGG
ncbi:MAG: hypothetical protein WCK98_01035 [bacterium]